VASHWTHEPNPRRGQANEIAAGNELSRSSGTAVTPGAVPRRRLGGRSAKVRSAVLEATFELAKEHGLAGFSITDVAQRAGVHPSSIYRRWGTREGLLVDALLSGVGSMAPIPDTGTLRGDLRAYLRASAAVMRDPEGALLLRLAVTMGDTASLRAVRDDYWTKAVQNASIMFDRAIERAELPLDVKVRDAVEYLVAPLYMRTLVTGGELDDEFLDGVVDMMLQGLAT
jgi:AcrR family transcriptional regulator